MGPPDSEHGLAFNFDRYGTCHTLQLDSSGRTLTAIGEGICHVFDLELRRVSENGQDWQPLEI